MSDRPWHETPLRERYDRACDERDALKAERDSLASRLDSCRDRLDASNGELVKARIDQQAAEARQDELASMLAATESRLDSLQNEHDSLKHDHERLFARDTANLNRLIECQRRLHNGLMLARSLYDSCPGEMDVMVLRLIDTLEPPSKCKHDWQPDEGKWEKCSRCGAIQHPAVDLLEHRARARAAPSAPSEDDPAQLVREIVAYFDVLDSKYAKDGTPVRLDEEWPTDWLRRARSSVSGCGAPSEGEKPSLRCGAIANDLVGQCIFADGHSGEHRYGS